MVEQVVVNDLVVGSNPTRGAYKSLNTPQGVFLLLMLRGRKCPMALPVGFEKRSDAVRRASWGREYLDFYEQSEIKSLVTRDRIL